MIMPLGDVEKTEITPYVNYVLIALNILVFWLQSSRPEEFTIAYAATPYEITHNEDLKEPIRIEREVQMQDPLGQVKVARKTEELPQAPVPFPVWMTLFTSIFMHGGLMHLLGNMLYLWIFGDNVEEVLGHVRYLLVYLACGFCASMAHILVAPNSLIPSLGASGAISGVMGMYLVWFPYNRVRVLFLRMITEMPAIAVIGLWILMQVFLGLGDLGHLGESGGVAYMAHVGGAVAGLGFGFMFRDRARWVRERAAYIGRGPWAHRAPAPSEWPR